MKTRLMTLHDVLATVPGRVEAGVAWLNANEPGWLSKVDRKRLNLRDGCNCIGGQLAGFFGRFERRHDLSYPNVATLGFVTAAADEPHLGESATRAEYKALTNAWRSAIAELRKEAS